MTTSIGWSKCSYSLNFNNFPWNSESLPHQWYNWPSSIPKMAVPLYLPTSLCTVLTHYFFKVRFCSPTLSKGFLNNCTSQRTDVHCLSSSIYSFLFIRFSSDCCFALIICFSMLNFSIFYLAGDLPFLLVTKRFSPKLASTHSKSNSGISSYNYFPFSSTCGLSNCSASYSY